MHRFVSSGTVERQAAHFYRITVTEGDLKAGVIITCKSTGKDKFKIVFFDKEGHVTMVEESQQSKRDSTANLYVVPYGRSKHGWVGDIWFTFRKVQFNGIHASLHDEAPGRRCSPSFYDSRHIWQRHQGKPFLVSRHIW